MNLLALLRRCAAPLCLGLPLFWLGAALPAPAAASEMFPFVLPWDDSSHGAITDVSFLNDGPAGANGDIVPRGGHFVQAKTGRRIKFLATNFVAKSAFPSHADAEKTAARLAKLGINMVRMHHMDNSDWGQAASIWDYSYKDRQHLSASQLDKLDYLIAQFRKNGVYVNLNLHVSRRFSAADGFPASVEQIPFSFDKRVDQFDRRMIRLQKDYAQALLTHVNPYTGLSYAQDPAVAVIEIDNETSLVGDPWATLGADLDTLPEPFLGELTGLWNDWLVKKYASDKALDTAWRNGVASPGPELLSGGSAWSSEHQGTSQADFTPASSALPDAAPDLHAAISAVDGVDWHVQAHVTGLDLHNDEVYTLKFRARSDTARAMPVAASLDQADWRNVGLAASAALTTEWQTFHYVFTVHDSTPNHARIAFTLGSAPGQVWISGLQIHAGAEGAGRQPGQSLAAKTVSIPASAFPEQHADWLAFLADTERAYADEMRHFLKDDLHVHANVICSQMGWGGLSSLTRESEMDFADNHAYWQHPNFPGKPWDPVNWTIANTSMVTDMAEGRGGTLLALAEYRVAGKPYSVSEYNHPAPSDFRAEMLPELATFAAFQDWDIINLFDYGDYGTGVQNDRINSYFGIGSDPAKAAFLPAAALIFRGGAFPPASQGVTLAVKPMRADAASIDQVWSSQGGGAHPFAQRLAIKTEVAHGLTVKNALSSAGPSKITLAKGAAGDLYTAVSPAAQSFAGYVGGRTVTMGGCALTFSVFGNNFAAGTLTAMDRKPIALSRRLLLTLAGKVENQNMVWNASRTSVGDQWGSGPTVAEGIPASVTLKTAAARHVWALDSTGKRHTEVPSEYTGGVLTFTVGASYHTLWYEIGP